MFNPTHTQWCADHINDMYADAVMAVVLQLQANPDLVCGCKTYHKELGYMSFNPFFTAVDGKEDSKKKKETKFPDRCALYTACNLLLQKGWVDC